MPLVNNHNFCEENFCALESQYQQYLENPAEFAAPEDEEERNRQVIDLSNLFFYYRCGFNIRKQTANVDSSQQTEDENTIRVTGIVSLEKQKQCKDLLVKFGYLHILCHYPEEAGPDFDETILKLNEHNYQYCDPFLLVVKVIIIQNQKKQIGLEPQSLGRDAAMRSKDDQAKLIIAKLESCDNASLKFSRLFFKLFLDDLNQQEHQDTQTAIDQLSETGDVRALDYKACALLVSPNHQLKRDGFECRKNAALQGDSYSMAMLGYAYRRGTGVECNFNLAIQCYQLPEGERHPIAFYELAELHRYGFGGVEQNLKKAVEFYVKSIKAGNIAAITELAMIENNNFLPGLTTNELLDLISIALDKFINKKTNDYQLEYEIPKVTFFVIKKLVEKLPAELQIEFVSEISEDVVILQSAKSLSFIARQKADGQLPPRTYDINLSNRVYVSEYNLKQEKSDESHRITLAPRFQEIVAKQKEEALKRDCKGLGIFLKVGLLLISNELREFLAPDQQDIDLLKKYSHLPAEAFMSFPFSEEKSPPAEIEKISELQKNLRKFFYGSEEKSADQFIPIEKNFLIPLLQSIESDEDKAALIEVLAQCFKSGEVIDLVRAVQESYVFTPEQLNTIKDLSLDLATRIGRDLQILQEEEKSSHKRPPSPSPSPSSQPTKKLQPSNDELAMG